MTLLYTIAGILVLLWLIGLIASYTFGGLLHVLLVVALVVLLINVISGQRRARV